MKATMPLSWCAFLLMIFLWSSSFDAVADSSFGDTTTLKERHHDRARVLREQSQDRARSHLGRETVAPIDDPNNPMNTSVDFHALGIQIQRLGQMIQRLADPAGVGLQGAGSRGVFGPEGPTEKNVRVFLEYRLMVSGNPRLAVGGVRDQGKVIQADVVTRDGSVVEVYKVDKSTGIMTPARE